MVAAILVEPLEGTTLEEVPTAGTGLHGLAQVAERACNTQWPDSPLAGWCTIILRWCLCHCSGSTWAYGHMPCHVYIVIANAGLHHVLAAADSRPKRLKRKPIVLEDFHTTARSVWPSSRHGRHDVAGHVAHLCCNIVSWARRSRFKVLFVSALSLCALCAVAVTMRSLRRPSAAGSKGASRCKAPAATEHTTYLGFSCCLFRLSLYSGRSFCNVHTFRPFIAWSRLA